MCVVGRAFSAVLAVIALVMALTLAGGAAASAADCESPDHSANGEGFGLVVNGPHSLRVAPSISCHAIVNLASTTKVWIWCAKRNAAGNVWWWVRVDGKATAGWIYEGNMIIYPWDDNGNGYVDWRDC